MNVRIGKISAKYVFLLAIFELCVVAQGILAWHLGLFTGRQMAAQHITGLPFVWQGAMWGDAFLLCPLIAWIICAFSWQWTTKVIGVSTVIAVAADLLLHWDYTKENLNSAHVVDHHLTVVGYIHLVYMGAAMIVLLLFFLFTPEVSRRQSRVVFWIVGIFLVMNFVEPAWYLGPDLFNIGTVVEITLILILLGAMLLKRRFGRQSFRS